ncbi:hypothetical protein K439DRAFT_1631915, partial [Ramaria rubella]
MTQSNKTLSIRETSIFRLSNNFSQAIERPFSTDTPLTTKQLGLSDHRFDDDDSFNFFNTEFVYDPSHLADTTYGHIFLLLESNTPWQITPTLLFNICHILEAVLTPPMTPPPSPSSIMLISVLRTMRIWRTDTNEKKTLEKLASDLASLIKIKFSDVNSMHTSKFKQGEFETHTCGQMNVKDQENIPPPRPISCRRMKKAKRACYRSVIAGVGSVSSRACTACAASSTVSQFATQSVPHTDKYGLSSDLGHPREPIHDANGATQVLDPFTNGASTALESTGINGRGTAGRTSFASIHPFTSEDNAYTSFVDTKNLLNPASFSESCATRHSESLSGEGWMKLRSQEDGWRL